MKWKFYNMIINNFHMPIKNFEYLTKFLFALKKILGKGKLPVLLINY